MKKFIVLLAVGFFVAALNTTVLAEEITIVGTGSGVAILKALAEAFTKVNPDVTLKIPDSIGTGGGIKAVGNDQAVVGRIARKIKDSEKQYGLSYVPFVKIPIVIFVNKSVGIKDITPAQICGIYSGAITNWKDVGGKDSVIKVVRREEGDSSLEVLVNTVPGFKDVKLTEKSKTTFSDPTTIEFVETKTDSICFGSYANAKKSNVDILTIAGKDPASPDYPYFGTLALIFKEKNNTGNIKKFVEYVNSPEAKTVIEASGGKPL